MRLKRRLLIIGVSVLAAAALILVLAPFLIASGLRLWVRHVTEREGLKVEMGEIAAPLWRPVVVKNLRLSTPPGAPFQIECTVPRAEVGLNVSGIFTGATRPLRALKLEGLMLNVRRDPRVSDSSFHIPWRFFEYLLADSFQFSGVRLHVENGGNTVDVRDGALSGSEMEPGVFSAHAMTVESPGFRKDFTNLRGATSWQDTRLGVGAVTLMRGLDVDTVTIDLSHIAASQIGIELSIDAFGGKLRARISSDDRANKRIWDIAGSGSGVSFAQMSDALEWNNRASGSLHASKFTFHGAVNDLRNATASVWAEVSGLTWRDRTADTVMIGASLYNRRVQIEQLYIKQRSNELTCNGEFPWPDRLADWTKPAFRGDISATINDLGDFARLFGQAPADFGGKLTANGDLSVEDGKLRGELSVSGTSLLVFRSEVESIEMKLELEESHLSVAHLDVRQKTDFLHADGKLALNGEHSWTGSVQASVAEIADYRGFLPAQLSSFEPSGRVEGQWKSETHPGTFQIRAREFRLAQPPTLPFEVELDAEFSAGTTFFRIFHLWNSRADLSAFVTTGKDYFQLQELRLSLNGKPHLQGNVFVPVSLDKARDGNWLAALRSDSFFDVDLTLQEIDLGELARAVGATPFMSGRATGSLQLSGTPGSLQGRGDFHARDFTYEGEPSMTADVEFRHALGVANFKGNLRAGASDPITAEAAFPLQLEKNDTGYAFRKTGPVSASMRFPAILLAKLPRYLARDAFTRGIVSGNLAVADSLEQPLITGDLNLIDGQLLGGLRFSGGVTFKGRKATIDFGRIGRSESDLALRGEVDFQDLSAIAITLLPSAPLAESPALLPGDCVSAIELRGASSDASSAATIAQIRLRGNLFAQTWTISLSNDPEPDSID
ncbi:MAG TPA: hypothetical protein VJS88_07350, partial [Chthoniobacterales bacterium]|nr:hypothetical protein [Chthoniobacterales bacterium]